MATSIPTLPTNIKSNSVTIVAADTSSLKTILTADGTFWDVIAINVTSDDTSDRLLQFHWTISGTDYLLGTVNIPTLSGTTGTAPAISALASANMQLPVYDALGNRILRVDTAIVLKVKSTTTVTAAKTITISATAIKS